MYVKTAPGGLKVTTLVIGFIVVNIGCDAVFNSENYREYIKRKESAARKVDEAVNELSPTFHGIKSDAEEAGCKRTKMLLDKWKDDGVYSKEHDDMKSDYEYQCTVPEWVIEELIFVGVSITCVVVSFMYFLMPIFFEKCASMRCMDGMVQIFLAAILFVGCASLMAAASNKYTEGKVIIERGEPSSLQAQSLHDLKVYRIRFYRKITASVFGFVTVNIGTNAVLNSPVYKAYRAAYLQELERVEPEAHSSPSECRYVEEAVKKANESLKKRVSEYKKLKKDIQEFEKKLEDETAKNLTNDELLVLQAKYIKEKNDQISVYNQIPRLELDLETKEYSRRKICDPHPAWVHYEFIFVVFAIGTVSVEFVSLVLGMINPETFLNDKVVRRTDGIFQFIMGLLIFVGSICLLSGLTWHLDDDGFIKRYPEESRIHWIADEVIFDLLHKEKQLEFFYNHARTELDKPVKKRKRFVMTPDFSRNAYRSSARLKNEFEKQKVVIDVQIRQIKRKYNYDEKISASAFGFMTSLLFVFSSGLIGRGIISIRIR